ncbi:MAG: methyltransferase domain-containing protein [Arenimonas sp.]
MYPQIRWHRSPAELVASAEPDRARMRAIEDHIVEATARQGWCVVCERTVSMTVFGGAMLGEHINLREGMVCQACGINARSRLLYLAAGQRFPDGEPRLALLEAFSPLAKAFSRRWPRTIVSEYMHADGAPGALLSRTLADGRVDSARHEDLMRLSHADASLDGIVHSDVLEHVAEVAVALRECRRVLKPGGSAVFTMPWFPWQASTRVRGRLRVDGSLEKLLPDEFHGDGLRKEGVYTFYNFGADLAGMLHEAGFADARFGACYDPTLGFLSNNYRYGDDGLMMPTVLMATA